MSSQYCIVISHHQSQSIPLFRQDIPTVFVFDDITPEDIAAVGTAPHVTAPCMGNRSVNRNLGLAYWRSHASLRDDDTVEFFDGDRYPVKYAPPEEEMCKYGCDVLLYPCEHDTRERLLVEGRGPEDTGGLSNAFYSCGFAITHKAVKQVESFNHGPFFREEFEGWGAEDQYMGLVLARLGIKARMSHDVRLHGSVGTDAREHPEYAKTMRTYIDLARMNGLIDFSKLHVANYGG